MFVDKLPSKTELLKIANDLNVTDIEEIEQIFNTNGFTIKIKDSIEHFIKKVEMSKTTLYYKYSNIYVDEYGVDLGNVSNKITKLALCMLNNADVYNKVTGWLLVNSSNSESLVDTLFLDNSEYDDAPIIRLTDYNEEELRQSVLVANHIKNVIKDYKISEEKGIGHNSLELAYINNNKLYKASYEIMIAKPYDISDIEKG